MILFIELMDESFFVMFSRQEELNSDEQFQLGTLLNIDDLTIKKIKNENKPGSSSVTIKLLKAWKSSAKNVGNSTSLSTQLSKACMKLKKADLVEFVRTGE